MINALDVAQYFKSGSWFETYEAGEKTKPLIMHLAAILDQLEPQGMDNYHRIWGSVRRPTFRQFYDYYYGYDLPYKEADPSELEEVKKEYSETYPTPRVWYRLALKHFTRNSGEEFYAVFVDYHVVFGINDYNSRGVREGTDLLEWAIAEAENVVEKVREGTYQEAVLDKIPYQYRVGKIMRRDLWDAYPEAKESFFKPYKKNMLKKFNKYYDTGEPKYPLLPLMTARIYYEVCAVVYTSLGIKRNVRSYLFTESESEREYYGNGRQTPKEMYYAIADGRDNGLRNVPMDDPPAFEEWRQDKGPYYEFNGSHPWEIIPSMSITNSMHLSPKKTRDGKYLFVLSGDSILRAPDTIIAADALYEAGYPIEISYLDTIKDRLAGNDFVSVVPNSGLSLFEDSFSLPKGKEGLAVARKVQWDFDEYKLRSEI